MVALTHPEYWSEHWKSQRPQRGFDFFDDVAEFLPHDPTKSFFEVGCAPGGILAEFCARLGYEANGIDYSCDSSDVERYLLEEGVKVGKIYRDSFLTWTPERKYDVVGSFGFIEHFETPAPIVDKHFEMVKPGGLVVITLPNFARGQKVLHWLFDRENLNRHNTACMSLSFLKRAEKRNQARLLKASYAGGHFDFWYDRNQKHGWLATRLKWRSINALKKLNSLMPEGTNPLLSPYIVSVFQAKA